MTIVEYSGCQSYTEMKRKTFLIEERGELQTNLKIDSFMMMCKWQEYTKGLSDPIKVMLHQARILCKRLWTFARLV
jgi:hypothetical protein